MVEKKIYEKFDLNKTKKELKEMMDDCVHISDEMRAVLYFVKGVAVKDEVGLRDIENTTENLYAKIRNLMFGFRDVLSQRFGEEFGEEWY